jgi:hypothetical protein
LKDLTLNFRQLYEKKIKQSKNKEAHVRHIHKDQRRYNPCSNKMPKNLASAP